MTDVFSDDTSSLWDWIQEQSKENIGGIDWQTNWCQSQPEQALTGFRMTFRLSANDISENLGCLDVVQI